MIMEKIRILIESLFDSKGFKKAHTSMQLLKQTAQKLNIPIYEAQRGMRKVGLTITKVGKYGARFRDTMTGAFISSNEAMKRLKKTTAKFSGYLLSIMFFGMQLKRIFLGFLSKAFASYMLITKGQTKAGRAMLRFQAAWEFFKFSMIEALSGLIVYFSTLMSKISDFIASHPKLMKIVAMFTLLGAVLGVLMMTVGSVGLGIWGLSQGLSVLAGVFGTTAGGAIAALLPIIGIIALIVGAVVLLYLAWTNNWFGIRDTLIGIWNNVILPTFQGIYNWLTNIITSALDYLQAIWNKVWGAIGPYVRTILSDLRDIWGATWNLIVTVLQSSWSITSQIFGLIYDAIFKLIEILERKLKPVWNAIWSGLVTVFKWFGNTIKWIWNNIVKPPLDALIGMLNNVKSVYESTLGAISRGIRGATATVTGKIAGARAEIRAMQEGGFISRPTLALLHPGETVLPKGTSVMNLTVSPTYTITGMGNADELRRILEEHDRELIDEIKRIKLPGV